MKLFKNRGDIYIPRSGRTTQQAKILFSLLAVIVVFTAVFVIVLHSRYATVADFFARGEVTVTEQQDNNAAVLPQIEGKTNFLILETDEAAQTLHYLFFLQADKDNRAYKVGALSPDMQLEQGTLQQIFSEGGGAALQTALMEYFAIEINYYAQFESSSMVEFLNKLGNFVYLFDEEIDFNGGGENDRYTLRINKGEQNVSGREASNVMRYLSQEKKNLAAQDEFVLRAVPSLFNEDNYQNADALFKLFMKSCKTDITVRDFENSKDALMVFCVSNMDVTLYACTAQYDDSHVMTSASIKEFKGYFNE